MRRSAVVVHVPEADPVVGEWRRRHTADGAHGMPSHVTLLVPFVPPEELNGDVEDRLRRLVARAQGFDAAFLRSARWPNLLYLEPEPAQPFVALTEAITVQWPEHPPYEGAFDVVLPHLTVAASADDELLDRIAAELEASLPLETRVREAQLFVEDAAGRWSERRRMPLAA